MLKKKQSKSSALESEQITHPTIDVETLRKQGKRVDKKSRQYSKNRVLEILERNYPNGLTQRQIVESMEEKTRLREQHVNNILHKLNDEGKIERFELPTQTKSGSVKLLIYNAFKK